MNSQKIAIKNPKEYTLKIMDELQNHQLDDLRLITFPFVSSISNIKNWADTFYNSVNINDLFPNMETTIKKNNLLFAILLLYLSKISHLQEFDILCIDENINTQTNKIKRHFSNGIPMHIKIDSKWDIKTLCEQIYRQKCDFSTLTAQLISTIKNNLKTNNSYVLDKNKIPFLVLRINKKVDLKNFKPLAELEIDIITSTNEVIWLYNEKGQYVKLFFSIISEFNKFLHQTIHSII